MEIKVLIVIISQAILGVLLTFKLIKNNTKQFPFNLSLSGISVFFLLLSTIGLSYWIALDTKDQQSNFESRLNDTASVYRSQIIDTTKFYNNKIADTVSKVKDIIVYLNSKLLTKDSSNQEILRINLGKIGNQIQELPVGKPILSVSGEEESIETMIDSSSGEKYGKIPLSIWNSGSAPAKNLIIKSIAIKLFKNGYHSVGESDISYKVPENYDLQPWNSVEVFRPLTFLLLNGGNTFFGIKYSCENYPEQFEMFFLNYRKDKRFFKYEYRGNNNIVTILKERGFL